MIKPKPPQVEKRRRIELRDELVQRARAWLPEWRPRDVSADFLNALLEVAARLGSEVTQRLDRIPEKNFRGFLDWLGVRGKAGKAARLPVVFTMAARSEPVLAPSRVQLQATGGLLPVTFETERELQIIPGTLSDLVGVDAPNDAFYLPPTKLLALESPKAIPSEWIVKSAASVGSKQLQLEPELGLDALPTLFHEKSRQHYRVTKAEGGIVTIEPPWGEIETKAGAETPGTAEALEAGERLTRYSAYDPFGPAERNRQEHLLYLGSEALLNLKADAEITIVSGAALEGAEWRYWGKTESGNEDDWQSFNTKKIEKDGLVLTKPIGDVVVTKVAGKSSRWLRVSMKPGGTNSVITTSQLKLKVNCRRALPCSPQKAEDRSKIPIEGLANTTPLVFDAPFFPFGHEPRQFDAFYVGSAEAFTKKRAAVEICLSTTNGAALAHTGAFVGNSTEVVLFGVGKDAHLHRFRSVVVNNTHQAPVRLPPIRPPFAENSVATMNAPPALLNVHQPQRARLTAVSRGSDVVVAMTAGIDVWLWAQGGHSRWYRIGPVFDPDVEEAPRFDQDSPPSVTLLREGDGLRLFAINRGRLYESRLPPGWEGTSKHSWKRATLPASLANIEWAIASPVFAATSVIRGADVADGLLAVDVAGSVFLNSADKWTELTALRAISTDVTPLGLKLDSTTLLIVVQQDDTTLAAWRVGARSPVSEIRDIAAIGSFDWSITTNGKPAIVFATRASATSGSFAAWFPLGGATAAVEPNVAYVSSEVEDLYGAPTVVANGVAASSVTAELLHRNFNVDGVLESLAATVLEDVLLIAEPISARIDDYVVAVHGGRKVVRTLKQDPIALGSNRLLLRPTEPFGAGPFADKGHLHRRRVQQTFAGTLTSKDTVTLENNDQNAVVGQRIVLVSGTRLTLHRIETVTASTATASGKITISPRRDHTGAVNYVYVHDGETIDIALRPSLVTDGLDPVIDAAIMESGAYFKDARPSPQLVLYDSVAADPAPSFVVFARAWTQPPKPTALSLSVNTIFGPPQPVTIAQRKVATLSWEFFDGTAWRRIKDVVDGTSSLTQTGIVRFCVPDELKPADVAGRTNHWIRARIVDGDYGREKFIPDPNNAAVLVRDTSDIKPPEYVYAGVSYSLCCASYPDFVITKDGNATRDQSDANTTNSASLEVFMPLAETLRRAAAGPAIDALPRDKNGQTKSAVPDCVDCSGKKTQQPAPASEPEPVADARALYLGFSSELKDGPISVLFLVDEGEHDDAYPLVVDVLRASRFEPVTAQDDTRGLNESGVLTFALDAAPILTSLFGNGRHWIRLRPNLRFDATKWRPRVRAAFVNATWAVAAETQTFEVLGSSDGSPGQRFTLARAPIVEKSLKLRVREPLGDEEKDSLLNEDPELVKETLSGREGRWVLWREVLDPADHPSDARVYALDHTTGDITFGDGVNGRIPPIGRDVIMAERYQRAGGEAANEVAAWSQINLITPLRGVESVAAPDGAAGGSDPQNADAVLRFAPSQQLMRDRALTLEDFEKLALQFSKDIAQVRAARTRTGVALVVVVRGSNPVPSQATKRELLRHLIQRASPTLAERGAVTIVPPQVVSIQLRLRLTISAIEHSGSVKAEVEKRIRALFDPATGGVEGTGWSLGATPSETDIAAAIIGATPIQGLDEIDEIRFWMVGTDGALEPMPQSQRPNELTQLATNGVTVEFELSSAEVPA